MPPLFFCSGLQSETVFVFSGSFSHEVAMSKSGFMRYIGWQINDVIN